MNNYHPNEQALQSYLIENTQDINIKQHISECNDCKQKLSEYNKLQEYFSKVESNGFNFDTSSIVLNRIYRYENQKNNKEAIVLWSIFSLFIILILVISIPYLLKIVSLFNYTSINSTLFSIGTGLLMLFYLLIDTNRKYKEKKSLLFN